MDIPEADQPQTLACMPSPDLLLPQTPLRPFHPRPMEPSGAVDGGLETPVAVEGTFSLLPGALKPWLRGDGRGVVDRLLRAGLDAVPWLLLCGPPEGRVPIGATAPLPGPGLVPGDPPGEELLVRLDGWAPGASKTPLLPAGLDCGLDVLLARERWLAPADWEPGSPSGPLNPPSAGGVRPYSKAPNGERPRRLVVLVVAGPLWGPGMPEREVPVSST